MPDRNKLYELSVSQFTGFVHCRYSWYLSHVAHGGGLRLKKPFLPTPIKLGAIWDTFQNHWYGSEPFSRDTCTDLCNQYALSDIDTAKVFALIRAWYKMDFDIRREEAIPQFEFSNPSNDTNLSYHGIIDVLYPGLIIENKLTGRPDTFRSIFTIHNQLAMYLMSQPHIHHVIVRAVTVPQLRLKKGEGVEEYTARMATDITARPSKYYLGYDRDANTFGIKYYRPEFNIDSFKQDFTNVVVDIHECFDDHTLCYQDKLSCFVPAQCMYLPVCQTGQVNFDMYEVKQL